MTGYIRVVNIRGDKDYGPEPGETVIAMDRKHPVLGNRHYLKNRNNLQERLTVIAANTRDLDADAQVNGPKTQAIDALAQRVAQGEKIVAQCHCVPLPCHLDEVAKRVTQRAKELVENRA